MQKCQMISLLMIVIACTVSARFFLNTSKAKKSNEASIAIAEVENSTAFGDIPKVAELIAL